MLSLNRIDLNKLMPFLIIAIPWVMVVRELFRGLTYGEMVEYLRRSSEFHDAKTTRVCYKDKEPVAFWLLYFEYSVIAVLVPLLIIYVLWQ